MKNKKKIIKILIVIIIAIGLILYLRKNNEKVDLYNDFLFFKFLNNQENNISKTNPVEEKYLLEVQYKNLDFTNIDLSKTIKKEKLVNDKIAPGVSGEFEIIIFSNKDTNYKVKFENKTEKPTNLKFVIGENIASNLKELEEIISGSIFSNEEKSIEIKWFWEYENQKDEEDTNIGINLEEFKFDICVIGEGR